MRGLLVSHFLVILSGVLPLTTRGDKHVDVTAKINDDVLLPCNCTNLNTRLQLKWQRGDDVIYDSSKPTENDIPVYKPLPNGIKEENCSLLLKKIKAEDKGIYKCLYFKGEMYTNDTVNLTINIPPNTTPASTAEPHTDGPNKNLAIIGILGLPVLLGLIWIVLCKRRNRNGDKRSDPHSDTVV